MKTLIKGGTIITSEKEFRADILIYEGIVVAVAPIVDIPADRTIDASGKLIIPGGVDVHTHLNLPVGDIRSSDDFETGTRAAAFGGTTTIIDFAQQDQGHSLHEAFDTRLQEAEKSIIDFGFHMVIVDLPDHRLREMDEMVQRGVTSFKLFTAYPDRLMVDEKTILQALRQTKRNGGLICVHAEDAAMIDTLVKRTISEGKISPKYHALTRPVEAEARAVKRVIELAQQAEAPVYFVHVSCAESLSHIEEARARDQKIFAETCPQYLFTSIEDFEKSDFEGAKLVFTPPPREKWNQATLWNGLKSGVLQVVSTDHCPFNYIGQKDQGKNDFRKIPNGAPGIEHRLQLLYHFGVSEGRISRNRWVDLCSTTPAKLFGLYPQKGTIAVGSDADIVIWDPDKEYTISASTHHMHVDYSLYEGWKIKGKPTTVISRGELIIENGSWIGKKKRGNFLKRSSIAN